MSTSTGSPGSTLKTATLTRENARLKSQVAVLQDRLSSIDEDHLGLLGVISRLGKVLQANNLGHVVEEAYDATESAPPITTTVQKQELIKDLIDFTTNGATAVQITNPAGQLVLGPRSPRFEWTGTTSDFIQISIGKKEHLAIILDDADHKNIFAIIHEETKKKKYRQRAFKVEDEFKYNLSMIKEFDVAPGGFPSEHKANFERYVKGDTQFLKELAIKTDGCRLAADVAVGRLSRKLHTVYDRWKATDPNDIKLWPNSPWMNELRKLSKERYHIDGFVDDPDEPEFPNGIDADVLNVVEWIFESDPAHLLDDRCFDVERIVRGLKPTGMK